MNKKQNNLDKIKMKGCFVMQRRFAYVAHYLARHLKDKYSIDTFCGFVSVRSSFNYLASQKDIVYTKLILDEEIHQRYKDEKIDINFLKDFEKKYGLPHVWPYITVDRVIMHGQLVREYPYDKTSYSHEEMLRILQVKAKAILSFLESEKPNFVFMTQPASMGTFLLYEIAKKMGVQVCVLIIPCVDGLVSISDNYVTLSEADECTSESFYLPEEYMKQAEKFITEFRDRPKTYSKIYKKYSPYKQFSFVLPHNLYRSVAWLFQLINQYFLSGESKDYTYIHPINYIKDHIKRKLRNFRNLFLRYDKISREENYVFFPLHYEPEMTLLLLAPYNTDQINTIKQIAKSLPVGFILYVKDHPMMSMYRPYNYYKRLKEIPNVKLINPSENSFDLIKNAKLLITITGTAGWEAAIMGIPVITLGDVFYNELSFVRKCKTPEQLPFLIKEMIDNKYSPDEVELKKYVGGIFKNSACADILYIWEQEKDEIKKSELLEPLADLLYRQIKK